MDFSSLATNFGGAGMTFVQGDFNYDGTVNSLDFTVLAQNFDQLLPAPAATLPTLFATGAPIRDESLREILP
jgi:hypothetical protein